MKRTTNLVFLLLCIAMLQVKAQSDIPTDYSLRLSYTEDISETWQVEDMDELSLVDLGSIQQKTRSRLVDHYETSDFERTTVLSHLDSNKDEWQTQPTKTILSKNGVQVFSNKGRQQILNNDMFKDKYGVIKKNQRSFLTKLLFPEFDLDKVRDLQTYLDIDILDQGQTIQINFSPDSYYIINNVQKTTTKYEKNEAGIVFIRTISFIPVYPECEMSTPIWLPGLVTEIQDVTLPSGPCAKKKRTAHRQNYEVDGGFICERRAASPIIRTTDLFSISPNPAVDMISINANEELNDPKVKVKLLDLTGKLILEHTFKSTQRRFGLQNVPAGVYMVDITTGNMKQVEKLIINK